MCPLFLSIPWGEWGSEELVTLDLLGCKLVSILVRNGRREGHCRDRAIGAHLQRAGYKTAQPERYLCCESKA